MQMTYRGRLIVYNILLFIITFCIVIFCVFQGVTYHFVYQAGEELAVSTQSTDLKLAMALNRNTRESDLTTRYQQSASGLSQEISDVENLRVLFFNTEGKAIADSSDFIDRPDFTQEIDAAKTDNKPVMTLKKINDASTLYYLAPVTIDHTFLGYMGFVDSLAAMDSFMNICGILFLIGGLAGLSVLVVVTLSSSRHFVKPIQDLTHISRQINEGNYNVHIHYSRNDEIGDLTQVFNQMSENINRVILQLDSERSRLAGVLASIDDGLLALDKDGNIITSNAYIKTYFNVANPKTIYDFQFQSFLRDMFDALKNGKEHLSEEIDCNGRNLLIIGSPIGGAGYEENYMIVIRNITATKQFQAEQKKFISSVSHELRTPLTTIIGYTDMLTRRQVIDPAILSRSLTTINREGHRLLRLVDDLLTVNQLDRPEFEFKKTNVDLHALLLDVIDQMQIKASQSEIEINYKSDTDMPDVLGDYDRLAQLFINILHNAIKYSDKGDIIDVVSTVEEEHIVISIRDYGVGISDVEKDKIFNAFYRVEEDRARSEGEGGAGLGLHLVKEIVDRHNGTITVDSHIGEGTNFIIRIPIIEKTIIDGGDPNATAEV